MKKEELQEDLNRATIKAENLERLAIAKQLLLRSFATLVLATNEGALREDMGKALLDNFARSILST